MNHIETIATGFLDSESWAECSCGWKGELRETEIEAAQDLVDHRKTWADPC